MTKNRWHKFKVRYHLLFIAGLLALCIGVLFGVAEFHHIGLAMLLDHTLTYSVHFLED